jgi:hypothetical protein
MKGITLSEIWNRTVVSKAEREQKPREYAWASECGGPLIDRYLKMKGIAPTNPPNERAKRKFFAGNLYEWIVFMVLNTAGVVVSRQEEVWTRNGKIPVKGKIDFLIGGKPDYDKAKKELEKYPLSEEIKWFFDKVIEKMSVEYTGEIAMSIKEIKSLSSFMFDRVDAKGPVLNHQLQLLHYQMGLNIGRGAVVYVCREDCRLREFDLEKVDELKSQYYSELESLHRYLSANELPPKEPLIMFDGRFSKSAAVEYSPYLTLIYGFNQPEDYRNEVDAKIARFNRVLKRVKDGAKMTDKNKLVIEEMEKDGYDVNVLAKSLDIPEEEDSEYDKL